MWQQGLQKLAQLPNFHCKISGLGMFDHDWTTDSLRPVVETVIEIFGPERCMFGSNFPVDKLHRDYHSLWQSYLQLCTAMTHRRSNSRWLDFSAAPLRERAGLPFFVVNA